jgi:hypothetical protein
MTADEDRDFDLARILDDAVHGLQPPPGPRLAGVRRRGARRRTQRWALPAAALAVALAGGLGWAVGDLTGGGPSPESSPRIPAPSTIAPTPTAPAGVRRCQLATTRGDFDADGATDVATLVLLARAGQGCRQAQYPTGAHPAHPDFRLQVSFRPGGQWQHRFRYCTAGPCGQTAFTATDLDGDGRAELAVDIGPGSAVDEVEFFRVDRSGFRPLRIAPSAALRRGHLQPGPAILGGGFDSGLQSPVSCQQRPNGTRVLVATRAEPAGANIRGPWRVTRVQFRLQDDTLHAVQAPTTTVHGFPITGPSFHLTCQ